MSDNDELWLTNADFGRRELQQPMGYSREDVERLKEAARAAQDSMWHAPNCPLGDSCGCKYEERAEALRRALRPFQDQ